MRRQGDCLVVGIANSSTHETGLIYIGHFLSLFKTLADHLYIGTFRYIVNAQGGDYFGISVGKSILHNWDMMKSGPDTHSSECILEATEALRQIFGLSSLDINVNHERNDFLVWIDQKRHNLSAMGSGFTQFLILFANLLVRKPTFVLIDEPELHLHPSLQLRFITTLRSFAQHGGIFATHNLGLARSAAEYIYSLRRGKDGHAELSLFDKTPRLAEFLGEMNFSAYQELGLSKILLVEGATEIKTIQQVLRHFRKDQDVVLIHLGGSGLIKGGSEYELQEVKRITSEFYALVDSERTTQGPMKKRERTSRKLARPWESHVMSSIEEPLRITSRRPP